MKKYPNIKILLINAYSHSNRGDAGIVVAMIQLLRKAFPGCEIAVMSSHWKENIEFYAKYNVTSVSAIWSIIEKSSSIYRVLNGIKLFIKSSFQPNADLFNDVKSADLICSVGGGYLYSSRKGPLGIGLLNALFHYWLGNRLGKNVVGFPQSVGPLNFAIDRYLARLVLSRVFHIFSRDQNTTTTLKSLRLSNFSELPDVALTLTKGEALTNFSGSPRIGITVLDWRFARKGATNLDIQLYLRKLTQVIHTFLSSHSNGCVYLFPQVDVGDGDTDISTSLMLKNQVNSKQCQIYSLKSASTPEQIISIYSEMDCFIGSRLHSAIFSIVGRTPTIGLEYQPKTRGTFRHMGIEDYVLDIENFQPEELTDLIEKCLDGKQPSPSKFIGEISSSIVDVLHNALDK